jgi:Arc/MetJ-type ribon-helix-helix transcriptional regulator
MAKSPMTFVRIQPEIRKMIDALAKAWGPVVPLTDSDVIREAIRRAHQAEFAQPFYHQGDPPAPSPVPKKSKKNRQAVLDGD